VGALRAVVQGGVWIDRAMVPLADVFAGTNVRLIVGKAVRVDAVDDKRVLLQNGLEVPYDVLVCATGSRNLSPAEAAESALPAHELAAHYERVRDALARPDVRNVIVVGGGAVGIELMGEVHDVYPDRHLTLVAGKRGVLGGLTPPAPPSLVAALHGLLTNRGVDVVNENVDAPKLDRASDGFLVRPPGGVVTTSTGRTINADVVLFALGSIIRNQGTGLYPTGWTDQATGELIVDQNFRVRGQTHVFAVGDVARSGYAKMAYILSLQIPSVARNVVDVAYGSAPSKEFAEPTSSSKSYLAVTFGKSAGKGNLFGVPLGDWFVSSVKGADLLAERQFKALTGRSAPAEPGAWRAKFGGAVG